jgi:hypothetical protein
MARMHARTHADTQVTGIWWDGWLQDNLLWPITKEEQAPLPSTILIVNHRWQTRKKQYYRVTARLTRVPIHTESCVLRHFTACGECAYWGASDSYYLSLSSVPPLSDIRNEYALRKDNMEEYFCHIDARIRMLMNSSRVKNIHSYIFTRTHAHTRTHSRTVKWVATGQTAEVRFPEQ